MTRSGAARNMGLMRHSRTAVRCASRPTCAHTPTQGGKEDSHARTSVNPLHRGSISFFLPGSNAYKHTHTHTHSRALLPPVPSCNHFNHSYIIQPSFLISSGDLFIYKPLRCAVPPPPPPCSGARPRERKLIGRIGVGGRGGGGEGAVAVDEQPEGSDFARMKATKNCCPGPEPHAAHPLKVNTLRQSCFSRSQPAGPAQRPPATNERRPNHFIELEKVFVGFLWGKMLSGPHGVLAAEPPVATGKNLSQHCHLASPVSSS